MKIRKFAGAVAASAVMIGVGVVPPAWATSNIKEFGVEETLKHINGPLIGYTVTGLMPSSDPVPYPAAGRLYEATVRANALVGTVTPAPNLFNARALNGNNYRSLPPTSLSAAPIGQGGSTTGKVYFDVVGMNPNSVVFNNGFEDILGWIQPPGVAPEALAPSGGEGGGGGAEGSGGSTGPNQASPETSGGEIGGGEEGTEGGGGNLDSGGGALAPSGDTGD
ncbi:DUF1942 domain-containing protein [Mycobacterium sp. ITM-2016-00318]|uniref:DUF1942 domain-containing protein n=1 Tax=Mycobacterium sp. ITM-2016-00318 TaxID=2099693 RepID=UPI002107A8F2|nr:DUF1942 domain-containing protein [Mycobacterium sp. ITM-2016-00318]WNG93732.1 DUF1942 domain-containing protein [Mycobacterium sp. ITM-2016-00318]